MQHKVQKGESLSSIAKDNGIGDWRIIYDHPKNEAFRQKRPDPTHIYPGDVIFVPEKKPNKDTHAGGTSETHPFKVKTSKGVWKLKWDPEEGEFGKVAKVKLAGETNLPDGTEVSFTLHDRTGSGAALPELKTKVSGKKVSVDWDLKPLNDDPKLYALDVEARLGDSSLTCNVARLKLKDRRCVAEELELGKGFVAAYVEKKKDAKAEKSEREPGPEHLLQVVAEAGMKFSTDHAWKAFQKPGAKSEDGESTLDKYRGVLAERRKCGSFEEFVDKHRAEEQKKLDEKDEELAKKEKGGEKSKLSKKWKAGAAYSRGGKAEIETRLVLSHPCEEKHTFKLAGGKSASLAGKGHKLELDWSGAADLPFTETKPTLYTLTGKGCEGKEHKLSIEVYPSDSFLFSFGLDGKMEIFEHLAQKLNKLLKLTGSGAAEFKVSGGLAAFFGWREDKDWRVHYAREVTAKFGVKWEFSMNISFVTLVSGIPQSLLEYVGDIGISVGLEGGIGLKGSLEHRHYPPKAKKEDDWGGKLVLEGAVGVSVGVYAKVGAQSLLGVEATGKIAPELKATGSPKWEGEKLMGVVNAQLEAGDFAVTITTTVLLVRHEVEWKFPLWEEQKIWDNKKWELYDNSKDQKQLKSA